MGWGAVCEPIGLHCATGGMPSGWVDGGKGAGEEEVSKQKGAGEGGGVGGGVGGVVVWSPARYVFGGVKGGGTPTTRSLWYSESWWQW